MPGGEQDRGMGAVTILLLTRGGLHAIPGGVGTAMDSYSRMVSEGGDDDDDDDVPEI